MFTRVSLASQNLYIRIINYKIICSILCSIILIYREIVAAQSILIMNTIPNVNSKVTASKAVINY